MATSSDGNASVERKRAGKLRASIKQHDRMLRTRIGLRRLPDMSCHAQ